MGTGLTAEVRNIEEQLREVYAREEIMYKQWSRVGWLKEGDQNTQYFHNRASHRKRKNTIRALKREDGTRCTADDEMREMAASFYHNLFTSEGSAQADRLLQQLKSCEYAADALSFFPNPFVRPHFRPIISNFYYINIWYDTKANL